MEQIDENNWKLNKYQYLRKHKDNYRVIYPIKDEHGKTIKKNLFIGRLNIWSALFLLVVLFASYTYAHDTKVCRELVKDFNQDPIGFCNEKIQNRDSFGSELSQYYNLTEWETNELNIPVSP